MQYIECPHCVHENLIRNPKDEEPTCELCDGYLEDGFNDDDEDETVQ